jgi:cbb3-type cytochrome oxidase maturation protein
MSVIILLIIFSVIVALTFLLAFIWAVKSGQYDDTKSPSVRMLFDEDDKNSKQKDKKEKPT